MDQVKDILNENKIAVTVYQLSIQNMEEKMKVVHLQRLEKLAELTSEIEKKSQYVLNQFELGTPEMEQTLETLQDIRWKIGYALEHMTGDRLFHAFMGVGEEDPVDLLFSIRAKLTSKKELAERLYDKLLNMYGRMREGITKSETQTEYVNKS